jgi:hypothetical protein
MKDASTTPIANSQCTVAAGGLGILCGQHVIDTELIS